MLDFTKLKLASADDAEQPVKDKQPVIDLETRKKEVGKVCKEICKQFDKQDAVIKVTGQAMLACLASITLTPYTAKTGALVLPQGAFSNELYQSTRSLLGEAFDKDTYRAILDLLTESKLLFYVRAGRAKQISFFASKEIDRTSEIATTAKAYLLSLTSE
jgi:hypothetical protein